MLVKVITKSVVPPAVIVVGANVLEIVGGLVVTLSTSVTVQVPEIQPAPVLVTPDGTEMDAVLVTCVCAIAGICVLNRNRSAHRPRKTRPARFNPNNEVFRRLNTFCLQIFKQSTR